MNKARNLPLIGGGIAVAAVVLFLLLPAEAHIEREILIDAPRATVFGLVNDFRQVNKWSAWLQDDPNARLEFTGAARGIGAAMNWSGTIAGEGRQEITSSVPYDEVATALRKGSQRPARTAFLLTDADNGTRVRWTYDASFGLNPLDRFLGLMLDDIVGAEFGEGLISLKAMAESLPRGDYSDLKVEHVAVEAGDVALLPVSSVPASNEIAAALGDAYFDVLRFMDQHNLQQAGSPLSISRGFSGSDIRFDAGIPVHGVSAEHPRAGPGVRVARTYGGPVIRVQHVGPYRALAATHDKIAAYLAALGIERNGDAWESYVSDPARVAEAEILTYVYYPVR